MKLLILAALSLAITVHGFARESFPGLKTILSDAEWKRAGLDRLSPDEIGVIDAALIRHSAGTRAQHESALAAVRAETVAAAENPSAAQKSSWMQRFGLSGRDGRDWRDEPPLTGKVTEWISNNRFKMDNGQVWEGMEPIIYELVDRPIEIRARPNGQFALAVDGKNTFLRVRRVK